MNTEVYRSILIELVENQSADYDDWNSYFTNLKLAVIECPSYELESHILQNQSLVDTLLIIALTAPSISIEFNERDIHTLTGLIFATNFH
ncbi:hypothetical protein JV59_26470 [Vibrio coralliilyticus]|nr:hypothetical protein JV59_26470 [Vibrio coralliilyticus]